MENSVAIMGVNLVVVVLMMVVGWLISLRHRNVTIVDSLWGLGFVLVTWITFFNSQGYWGRSLLIAVLATLWGMRLTLYLSKRNWGAGEDPRYGKWREAAGDRFKVVSFYKVFLVQALFLWTISLVLQVGQIATQPDRLGWFEGLGLALWLIGFLFETIGDRQLARFKADSANKGRVMDKGLWAYTRHPNYFGECLVWWGFYVISLSTPYGWLTVISPIIITLVLLKMTGIPLTEKTIMETRPEYLRYIKRTSAFIPWFPKKSEI